MSEVGDFQVLGFLPFLCRHCVRKEIRIYSRFRVSGRDKVNQSTRSSVLIVYAYFWFGERSKAAKKMFRQKRTEESANV